MAGRNCHSSPLQRTGRAPEPHLRIQQSRQLQAAASSHRNWPDAHPSLPLERPIRCPLRPQLYIGPPFWSRVVNEMHLPQSHPRCATGEGAHSRRTVIDLASRLFVTCGTTAMRSTTLSSILGEVGIPCSLNMSQALVRSASRGAQALDKPCFCRLFAALYTVIDAALNEASSVISAKARLLHCSEEGADNTGFPPILPAVGRLKVEANAASAAAARGSRKQQPAVRCNSAPPPARKPFVVPAKVKPSVPQPIPLTRCRSVGASKSPRTGPPGLRVVRR